MKFLQFVLLFFTTFCFAQKEYSFDHLIHYEYTRFIDSATTKSSDIYYLTNSNQNDYFAVMSEADSLNFHVYLKDENGIESRVRLPKANFSSAGESRMEIKCASIFKYEPSDWKYLTNVYAYSAKKDTLINSKNYISFILACKNPELNKNRNIGSFQYIMDETSEFHLPVLTSSVALEEWKLDKKLPNTIYKEKIYTNNLNQIEFKEDLIDFKKVAVTIFIPEGCDLAKRMIQTKGAESSEE
jgi:hypothetical protein